MIRTNTTEPIYIQVQDVIVDFIVYFLTAIGYINLTIILYFMIKNKEEINYYTVYKYQTLPISAIYIFTKLPLFSDNLICQNLSVYRNFFFILVISVQTF